MLFRLCFVVLMNFSWGHSTAIPTLFCPHKPSLRRALLFFSQNIGWSSYLSNEIACCKSRGHCSSIASSKLLRPTIPKHKHTKAYHHDNWQLSLNVDHAAHCKGCLKSNHHFERHPHSFIFDDTGTNLQPEALITFRSRSEARNLHCIVKPTLRSFSHVSLTETAADCFTAIDCVCSPAPHVGPGHWPFVILNCPERYFYPHQIISTPNTIVHIPHRFRLRRGLSSSKQLHVENVSMSLDTRRKYAETNILPVPADQ